MKLRSKANSLLDLLDKYWELNKEREALKEKDHTFEEWDEVDDKITIVLQSIDVMCKSIGNHFEE